MNGKVECIETIADLKMLSAGAVSCVFVLGYHTKNDGGGVTFTGMRPLLNQTIKALSLNRIPLAIQAQSQDGGSD